MYFLNLINKIYSRILFKILIRRLLRDSNVQLESPYFISNFDNILLETNIYIGAESWLSLRGKLIIHSGVIIGPRLKVHTSNHQYEADMIPYGDKYVVKDVLIRENVWIGSDVTILPGVTIGEGAVIGACSCITKDVPAFAIVGGNPAKILKYRDIENYNKCKSEDRTYLKLKAEGRTLLKDSDRVICINKKEKL